MQQKRLVGLDVLRGWAILLMIIFHFTYNLNYFHFIEIDLKNDFLWVNLRYLIVTLFLFSVGVSLALVHTPRIRWKKMFKRTLVLGIASLLVTVGTYLVFPQKWVYFGVLHFILFASWLGLVFLPYPRFSFLTAVLILIGSYLGFLHTHYLFVFLQFPLHLPQYTTDVMRFFPWFSVLLLGISAVGFNLHRTIFNFSFLRKKHRLNTFLAWTGQHALIIYLLHQPLLFGITMLLYYQMK